MGLVNVTSAAGRKLYTRGDSNGILETAIDMQKRIEEDTVDRQRKQARPERTTT